MDHKPCLLDDLLLQVIDEVWYSIPIHAWNRKQSDDHAWLYFSRKGAQIPRQGWKLHISAGIVSAREVLRRILPLLLTDAAYSKVTASLSPLGSLNQGENGISQIGKFITVYPRDEQEAVRLAVQLDQITEELNGPTIPSDRVLHPTSLVYYRYGSFASDLLVQSPLGLLAPAITTPENKLVADRRLPHYSAPDWAIDPFVAAGVAADMPEPVRLLADRYLLMTSIASSPTHIVYLAADLDAGRSCVVKGPGLAWLHNPAAQEVNALTRYEADMLAKLAPDPHFPALLDLVEHEGQSFLVLEDIEGENLTHHVGNLTRAGCFLSLRQIIHWAQQLADILEALHAKGFVYHDLKSSNVIVGKDGFLHLVDFELMCTQGRTRGEKRGTVGYMSPQQSQGLAATVLDDIFSFGVLLSFLITGAEPSQAPDRLTHLARPLTTLRPGLPTVLQTIVERMLQEEPIARYASIAEVKDALSLVRLDEALFASIPDSKNQFCQHALNAVRYRDLAGKLLDTLCSMAQKPPSGAGLAWVSTHPLSYGMRARDINTGNAGTLLALAELAAHLDRPGAVSVLAEGARWLRSSSLPGVPLLPGLYIGEAGVGAALLRAGQVLREDQWLVAAIERARKIVSVPCASPDLFNGRAGCLRFHLLLWDETGEREQLQSAISCGEYLLTTAIHHKNGDVYWTIPEGYENLSGKALLGYAHGVAGIADALLDLFEETADERYLHAIRGAENYLTRLAQPVLDDQSGLNWPRIEGGELSAAFWCHGATGIGRFFLHAARCGLISDEMASRAALTVGLGTRWAGPTQCHGLAGNIEFLLDMYQATGKELYLENAYQLAYILESFVTEEKGLVVFSSDVPRTYTPDYMVGYSGVAVCLLRLSAPVQMPHQLSRAGFRYHPNTTQEDALQACNRIQGGK